MIMKCPNTGPVCINILLWCCRWVAPGGNGSEHFMESQQPKGLFNGTALR
jgi:hypothetical protein